MKAATAVPWPELDKRSLCRPNLKTDYGQPCGRILDRPRVNHTHLAFACAASVVWRKTGSLGVLVSALFIQCRMGLTSSIPVHRRGASSRRGLGSCRASFGRNQRRAIAMAIRSPAGCDGAVAEEPEEAHSDRKPWKRVRRHEQWVVEAAVGQMTLWRMR